MTTWHAGIFGRPKITNYKSHKNDQLPCSTGTPSISSVTLKIPLLPGVTTTSSPRKGADFQWFWHCGFELTSVPALVLRHCNGLNIQSQEPLAALALIPLQVRLARVNQTCCLSVTVLGEKTSRYITMMLAKQTQRLKLLRSCSLLAWKWHTHDVACSWGIFSLFVLEGWIPWADTKAYLPKESSQSVAIPSLVTRQATLRCCEGLTPRPNQGTQHWQWEGDRLARTPWHCSWTPRPNAEKLDWTENFNQEIGNLHN